MTESRLYDLVYQQRVELHEAGLITDEEYADLAAMSARDPLKNYDDLPAVLNYADGREAERREILALLNARWSKCCDDPTVRASLVLAELIRSIERGEHTPNAPAKGEVPRG